MSGFELKLLWDHLRYGERRRKVLATGASEARKLAALNRIWHRMCRTYGVTA